jgi:hypothetical protein
MLDKIPTLSYKKVASIPFNGDGQQFDLEICNLGGDLELFKAVNPYSEHHELIHYVKSIPKTIKCIILSHNGEWIVKLFRKGWKPLFGYMIIELSKPNLKWEVNQYVDGPLDIDKSIIANFEMDPWQMDYELVWYIDPNTHPKKDKVWAFKCKAEGVRTQGIKDMGYVDLIPIDLEWQFNKKIENVLDKEKIKEFKINPWNKSAEELYEFIWYVDPTFTNTHGVWASKCKIKGSTTTGTKDMGTVSPIFPKKLDVVFISYDEPNAENNWMRVLEKAPHAKRINGVAGIFEAHKAAARIADTDMFYVVDGDAYLTDDWTFDFQPGIFDRDCAYVWTSKNPLNNLIYQNGGVKLVPRTTMIKARRWTTLDMFSGIMSKNKAEDIVSCIGTFNTDPFLTWRSAFRECVKLYNSNQMSRLNEWMNSDNNKPFGEYAVFGARAGFKFAEDNKNNYEELKKINDYKWLNECFQKLTK